MSDNSNNDHEIINSIIAQVLSQSQNNKELNKITSIELCRDNSNAIIDDINSEPFTRIPISEIKKIPSTGKLTLRIEIREFDTERDVTGIANINVKDGVIRRPKHDDIEIPEFDTIEGDADESKNIDSNKLTNTAERILSVFYLVISIFNAIKNV